MWTCNLDYLKIGCIVILCNLGDNSNKRTFFVQLILLTHEEKNDILNVCYKISPLTNQELGITTLMQI